MPRIDIEGGISALKAYGAEIRSGAGVSIVAFEAVDAGGARNESAVTDFQLKIAAGVVGGQLGDEATVVQQDGDALVVEAVEFDAAGGVEAERHGADLNFGTRVRTRAHHIAVGQWLVERREAEFAGVGVVQVNLAARPGDATDPTGRVVFGECGEC